MTQAPVTLENIKAVLMLNKMQGRIETGYRFWLCDFINVNSQHAELNDVAKRIRQLWDFTSMSTSDIEQSERMLNDRIKIIAKHYYAVHLERLKVEGAK